MLKLNLRLFGEAIGCWAYLHSFCGFAKRSVEALIKILIKVLSSNLLVTGLKLISGFVFPALMKTEDYADYQTFNLYLSYVTILHLGFPSGMFIKYGGKKYSDIEKSRYKSEVIVLVGILGGFTLLFGSALIFVSNRMLLYITVCIIPYCVVSAYQALYQAWGEFSRFARTHINTAIIPILGVVVLYFIFGEMKAAHYIDLFIIVYILYTAVILIKVQRDTKGAKQVPLVDKENWHTLKTGFSICVGNYISILFGAVGKQIVKVMFDVVTFATFSFGLSLQNIMTVFITSVAQPMYNFLAKGNISQMNYNRMKEILFVFGSCSGFALHACRLVVAWLVPQYNGSIEITSIYFMAFPAMAVINCMYINLYKYTRQAKQYVFTLVKVLIMAIVLNLSAVFIYRSPISVTIATVMVYYIWLVMDGWRFQGLQITIRDGAFLSLYAMAYLVTLRISSPILAAAVYGVLLCVLSFAIYMDAMREIAVFISKKLKHQ